MFSSHSKNAELFPRDHQANYMIRMSSEWFKFHDDNDPKMKNDLQTFTQWTIILILSIFDVTTSILLFLLMPPSNFHSTVKGNKKMKDSFERIFTYLIGGKWWGLFGIWVWFYMILVELKGFKGKSKPKFNCFYCQHLNFTENLISNEEILLQIRDTSFLVYPRIFQTCFCFLSKRFTIFFCWKDVESTFYY